MLVHTALFCWFVDIQHCFGASEALAVFLLVRWHTAVLLVRLHTAVFCRFGGISKVLLGIDVTLCCAYAVKVAVERWDSSRVHSTEAASG